MAQDTEGECKGGNAANARVDNLRYTASYYIFNESRVASTPCITSFSCGHFLKPLDYNGLAVLSGAADYGYCAT